VVLALIRIFRQNLQKVADLSCIDEVLVKEMSLLNFIGGNICSSPSRKLVDAFCEPLVLTESHDTMKIE